MESLATPKMMNTGTQCPVTPATPITPVSAAARQTCDDQALVALCLNGNQTAWNRFVATYGAVITHAVTWTLTHHGSAKDAADDIVQDIFFRLIKSEYTLLAKWDANRGTLKTWLAVLSRSATIDFLRTDRTYMYDAIEEHEHIVDEASTLLDLPELPLNVLSTRQKSVLQCLYGEELTPVEAAAKLDIHPQTIRSIHHTAIQKLRAAMFH
ncbi:MAG: sigma-70 family RNA polymerase sigma factor [Desulfovibrionales bacterium]|nr:sigma-70 family RNA polymerase sigma factor [Desulfovibrionales bacterium]